MTGDDARIYHTALRAGGWCRKSRIRQWPRLS